MDETMIYHLYEKWLKNGKVGSNNVGEHLAWKELDHFIETELGKITKLLDNKESEVAFATMAKMISFLNSCVYKKPSIIDTLEKWVKKLHSTTHLLAKQLGAESFSVSVGMPIGLSIGLSFPV